MRPLTALLFGIAASSSLACGVFEHGPRHEDSGDGLQPVAERCENYLDCIAVTAPGELADLEADYGEGGLCWEFKPRAESCEEACGAAMEDLAQQHPGEPQCAGETADDGCPFTDGSWDVTVGSDFDGCGLAVDGETFAHRLTCADETNGTFTLAGDLFFRLSCESTGNRGFQCLAGNDGEQLFVVGNFAATGILGEGAWTYETIAETSCITQGPFEMVYAE